MDETPNGTAAGTADWAICCSGGGIRSATYCLGALQSLARGLYPRTRWIVGVSGGSYIAASLSLVRHNLSPQHTQAAYARGSAEEQHLRDNTRYIAPDAKTVLVGALSLLLGVAVTFTLVMAPVYALSHVWGWLLRTQGILTWTRTGASASVMAWSWWLAPAAAAGLTLILFIFWWATLPARGALRGAQRARRTGWAAAITAALALGMLAAPPVIAWLYHSTGTVGTIVHAIGFGGTGHWSFGTLGSLAAALVAAAGWCRTRLARVKAAQTQQDPAASTGVVTTVARWVVSHLTPWLASAVVVAIGLVAALTWIGAAAHTGYTPGQL
ncbi:MAG TPA: patatin-like phospholipase family protein, partial [Streptosporangiaceae bacterium]